MAVRAGGLRRPKLRRVGASDAAAATAVAASHQGMRSTFPSGAAFSATTRFHWAGVAANSGSTGGVTVTPIRELAGGQLQGGGGGGIMHAIPDYALEARSITRLIIKFNALSGGASAVRVAVYSATRVDGELYPDALLVDAGEYTEASSGSGWRTTDVSVSWSAGQYLFYVFNSNATWGGGGGTIIGLRTGVLFPYLGFTITNAFGVAGDVDSGGVGWRHAQAFGAFPATFPQSAPTRLVVTEANAANVTIPGIGYQFVAA